MSKCAAAPCSFALCSHCERRRRRRDCLSSPDRHTHGFAVMSSALLLARRTVRRAVSALSPLPPPPALLLGPLPPSPPSLLCICSDRCHRRLRATLPKLNVALIAPSLTRSSPNSRSLARSGARGVEGERGGTTERNVQSVGRRLGPAHSRTTDGQRRSGVSSGRQAEDGRTRRDGHCPPLHCLAPLPSETD